MDRAKVIFGNEMPEKVYNKAINTKRKYIKKFGNDEATRYRLGVEPNSVLAPYIGVQNIVIDEKAAAIEPDKGVVIGNIRMGYGHYRISIAIASAAYSMGYTPYWFDLHSYSETTGGRLIAHLNKLYSLGSRLSQKYSIFNKLYWEPLNSEGFKKLSYNAADQKAAELMTTVYKDIPKDMPFLATHVWPAQAAIHSGVKRVINVIPDNWPMGLHLAEGSIHTVQTPSSYLGYKTLKGMDGNRTLKPIPEGDIHCVGHYVDHELVVNLEADCKRRLDRIIEQRPKRILLTIGGAGAQKEIFAAVIRNLLPKVRLGKAVLYINVGDYINVWEQLNKEIPELKEVAELYFDSWEKSSRFAETAIKEEVKGVHVFCHQNIFEAVYTTNLLMRSTDIMLTKPSELAFYPVPKLLIKRVGGHEAWGAVRAAEIGDGTIECGTIGNTLQMLELMLSEKEILTMLCENIVAANKIGIYSGAYKAVELAVKATGL